MVTQKPKSMIEKIVSLLLLIELTLSQSAFEFVCNTPEYTLFCNLTIQVGLDTALNDSASAITLFVPNNGVLSPMQYLVPDNALLRELLEYHVLPQRRESFSLGNLEILTMLNNRNVTHDWVPLIPELIDESGFRAPIIMLDNAVSNGFVHGIAGVLIPNTVNAILPGNVTTTDAPVNVTTTDVPKNITTTDVTTTDAPINVTTTDVPSNITTSAVQPISNITTTDVVRSRLTLINIIESDPELSILDGILTRLNLRSTLDRINATVFAPTNAAFIATGLNLTEMPDDILTLVLNYHISLESNLTTDNIQWDQVITTMLNNETILARQLFGSPFGIGLQDQTGEISTFRTASRIAINGVLNTINRVLLSSIFIPNTTSTLLPMNTTSTLLPANMTTTSLPMNTSTTIMNTTSLISTTESTKKDPKILFLSIFGPISVLLFGLAIIIIIIYYDKYIPNQSNNNSNENKRINSVDVEMAGDETTKLNTNQEIR